MTGGVQLLDQISITLRGLRSELVVYIDVFDNSLSRKWLASLNYLLAYGLHLEKNYCWLGWTGTDRNLQYLCQQVNNSIDAVNRSNLDYQITDWFEPANCVDSTGKVNHAHLNLLHRYFEDLQGWSGNISTHYHSADSATRWHIRQLNLLCHEIESLILSMRKDREAPDWKRPSQLMCWLQAPRFNLEESDYDLFGIDTINRGIGGVYVGVNKAVGKHHWEVFNDEGRDSRISELTTTGMRGQTEAAGDFDIEWGLNPAEFHWQKQRLEDFRHWLITNNFDPDDKTLTIGHPQIGQVNLMKSFGTQNHKQIWHQLQQHLDVFYIQTSAAEATYNYRWSDPDYAEKQWRLL